MLLMDVIILVISNCDYINEKYSENNQNYVNLIVCTYLTSVMQLYTI